MGDEDGFETRPERRRGILPALIALASLVTLGAVLGLAVSLGNRGDGAALQTDDVTTTDLALSLRNEFRSAGIRSFADSPGTEPAVAILPTGAGPCVNDETQTCQNSYLVFRNTRLKQREAAVRRALRSLGFVYEGSFEPGASNATGGVGLLFRRGEETVAVYLQPNTVTNVCSDFPARLGIDPSCADIISESA